MRDNMSTAGRRYLLAYFLRLTLLASAISGAAFAIAWFSRTSLVNTATAFLFFSGITLFVVAGIGVVGSRPAPIVAPGLSPFRGSSQLARTLHDDRLWTGRSPLAPAVSGVLLGLGLMALSPLVAAFPLKIAAVAASAVVLGVTRLYEGRRPVP